MTLLADYLKLVPAAEADKRFVDKSMQLSGLLCEAMQRQGLTQRELASRLGKQESEVSRWLSGTHNFTLKTITRLEAVLGEDLVLAFRDAQAAPVVLIKQAGSRTAPTPDRWTQASFQEPTGGRARPASSTVLTLSLYADAA